jgi:hypothetical protein
MTRKGGARTQQTPGTARVALKEQDAVGRKARPTTKKTTGTVGLVSATGTPPSDAHDHAAQVRWLETIRALARAAAQHDHNAALYLVQVKRDEKGK